MSTGIGSRLCVCSVGLIQWSRLRASGHLDHVLLVEVRSFQRPRSIAKTSQVAKSDIQRTGKDYFPMEVAGKDGGNFY